MAAVEAEDHRKHNNEDEDDDDVPRLSADTLAALHLFYQEKEKRENLVQTLAENGQLNSNIFQEDWQLSQFWYNRNTIETLVDVIKMLSHKNTKICLISCPTLYGPLNSAIGNECQIKLLEYDERFAVYGENFLFYDYNNPTEIPNDMKEKYDIVVADPPFLSEECLAKTATTVKLLTKDKIILCTGAVMKSLAEDLLGLTVCKFKPEHENNLGNDFACYANFDLDSLIKR